jgi:hypothetical protein
MTPIVTTLQASSPTRGRVAVPPSAADSLTPNLPSGLTLIGDTTFPNSTSPAGWTCTTFTAPSEAGPYAATSFASVFDTDDAGGAVTGRSAKPSSYGGVSGFREMYVAFAFKLSANFQHNAAGSKTLYPSRVPSTPSGRDFMLLVRPIGTTTSGQYRWRMETLPPSGSGSSSTSFLDNVSPYSSGSPYVCNSDEWIRVQTHAIYNTPGMNDGVFRVWLARWNGSAWADAAQVMEHTNVSFAGASDPSYWTTAELDNYMGGALGETLPEPQSWFYNRVHVSIGRAV